MPLSPRPNVMAVPGPQRVRLQSDGEGGRRPSGHKHNLPPLPSPLPDFLAQVIHLI